MQSLQPARRGQRARGSGRQAPLPCPALPLAVLTAAAAPPASRRPARLHLAAPHIWTSRKDEADKVMVIERGERQMTGRGAWSECAALAAAAACCAAAPGSAGRVHLAALPHGARPGPSPLAHAPFPPCSLAAPALLLSQPRRRPGVRVQLPPHQQLHRLQGGIVICSIFKPCWRMPRCCQLHRPRCQLCLAPVTPSPFPLPGRLMPARHLQPGAVVR